jgi:hypothetical protein
LEADTGFGTQKRLLRTPKKLLKTPETALQNPDSFQNTAAASSNPLKRLFKTP